MSVPPPGWVEPAPRTFDAPERVVSRAPDMRTENRRLLDTRRALARAVDWLAIFAVAKLLSRGWSDGFAAFVVFQFLLLMYNHLFEVTTGATLGKRLMRLRVASLADGGLPSPRQAATRGVIGIFEIGPIAAIAIIVNKQRRRLGDYAAGTAVVDARKHTVAPRPLFLGAITYPAVWLIPTLIVCTMPAHGSPPSSYRAQVNSICAQADADTAISAANAGVSGVATRIERRNGQIAALTVPADWQARHRQLLAALAEQAVGVRQSVNTWARDVDPSRFAAVVAADSVRLPGYESC